jgi:DNA-binding IclR family transcriptional regulator
VPAVARRLVATVRDDRTLGLLVALEAADGLSARALLDAVDYCESDLNGLLAELRAAGLVETATVDGEDGYRLTEDAAAVVRRLQSATSPG